MENSVFFYLDAKFEEQIIYFLTCNPSFPQMPTKTRTKYSLLEITNEIIFPEFLYLTSIYSNNNFKFRVITASILEEFTD